MQKVGSLNKTQQFIIVVKGYFEAILEVSNTTIYTPLCSILALGGLLDPGSCPSLVPNQLNWFSHFAFFMSTTVHIYRYLCISFVDRKLHFWDFQLETLEWCGKRYFLLTYLPFVRWVFFCICKPHIFFINPIGACNICI